MGLLDINNLLSNDQTRTALGLLAAAGPSAVPQSFGQRLMGGLLQSDQIKQQQEQSAQAKAFRDMQMQQMALQYQQAIKAQQQADLDRTLTQQAVSPVKPIEANAASGITGPRPAALGVVGQQPAFDPRQFVASGGSLQGAAGISQLLAKQQAKLSKLEPMRGPDGQLVNVAVFEDGTTKILPYGVRPELVFQDLGGKVAAVDKNAIPSGTVLSKTMTPGEAASNALGWANYGVSRDRLKLDQDSAGGVTYQTDGTGQIVALPKRPAMGGPVTAVPVQGQGNQGRKDANEALAIIGDARKYLDSATGSGVGAATDAALGFFGKATEGGKATAQLQALSGALVAKMPKMSGPQSDKDVSLYKQMAADIGNPFTPVEQRKAALDVVEQLQRKYAGLDPMTPSKPVAVPGLKFLGFEGR